MNTLYTDTIELEIQAAASTFNSNQSVINPRAGMLLVVETLNSLFEKHWKKGGKTANLLKVCIQPSQKIWLIETSYAAPTTEAEQPFLNDDNKGKGWVYMRHQIKVYMLH